MRSIVKLFFTGFFVCFAFLVVAQKGIIRGSIIDNETGEPLIGATAVIAGTTNGASTDLDGKFQISNVEPGKTTVQFSYISYQTQVVENIEVKPEEATVLNIRLISESMGLQEVVVQASIIKDNEAALLTVQKKSASVLDAISASQFSKNGDSDAASAIKRVTGVSVEGGKYIYVRGLGDRYSKTSLNSAEIPGLDPNRNSVQMDLFPSNLLDNIIIYKTFSPELPGSFSGGFVNVSTKDFPDQFTVQASASSAYNTNATFNTNYLTHDLGESHWLGFAASDRNLPEIVADGITNPSYNNPQLANQVTQEVKSFSGRSFAPQRNSAFLDHNLTFSVGDQKEIFGKKIGFIGGISYKRSYDYYRNGDVGRYFLPGSVQEENLETVYNLKDERGQESVLWGALFNTTLQLSDNNKVAVNLMQNQSANASTRFLEGTFPFASGNDPNFLFQGRSLEYTERALRTAQIKGDHRIFSGRMKVDWLGAITRSTQEEPDLRYFNNLRLGKGPDYTYDVISNNLVPASRYFRNMSENNTDAKVNVEVPAGNGDLNTIIKFGASYLQKERIFTERIIEYRNPGTIEYNNDIDEYFSDENLGTDPEDQSAPYTYGLHLRDVTSGVGSYQGKQIIPAAYAMVNWQLNHDLKISTGVRYEQTNISIRNTEASDDSGNELIKNDILPALNATYNMNDKTNFRIAYGRTIARPTFREMSPFKSFDFQGDFILIGNPDLQRTVIDNFDLRWETYPATGEIISFSAFYKQFQNPIERAIDPNTNDLAVQVFFRNVPTARLMGTELELRKNLGFAGHALNNFTLGANFAYIYSRVDISEGELKVIRVNDPEASKERVMFGQSPFVINAILSYDKDDLNINLNYNVQGERLSVVSTGGTPNVFEQPRPVLDLNARKQLNNKWSIRLAAKNLLDSEYAQTHEYNNKTYYYQRYQSGREFSAGLTFLIE